MLNAAAGSDSGKFGRASWRIWEDLPFDGEDERIQKGAEFPDSAFSLFIN